METTNERESLRSLSVLYSNSTLREILSDNSLCSIKPRVAKHREVLGEENNSLRFRDLLSTLYESMSLGYCNEYVYKNSILNNLLLRKYKLETTTLLNEFRIGKSIADLVFINGEVKVFELKTELDTLSRLEAQLEDYKKVAEKIFIVANGKHIKQLEKSYSHLSFGIVELTNELDLKIHKDAEVDNSCFEHTALFKLLRKEEYLNVVNSLFGLVPEVPNTALFSTCLEMVKSVDIISFQSLIFAQLKARKLKEPELLLSPNTPIELRFLCHSLDLKENQYHSLFNLLSCNI